MDSLKEKILCELDNLDRVLFDIKNAKPLDQLNHIEIIGISALIQNFYSGIESILKQIFKETGIDLPYDKSWHKLLLTEAVKNKLISDNLSEKLREYLGFRHFFIHAYGFNIKKDLLTPLLKNIYVVYENFKKEINMYII